MSSRVAVELADFHARALGIAPDTREMAMQDLVRIDKERLVERHQIEVAALQADIEGWRRDNSDLGDVIRTQHRKINRQTLWLAISVGIAVYFLVRDFKCGAVAPWWG